MSEKEKESIKKRKKEEQGRKRKSEVVEMGKSLQREQEQVKLLCRNKELQEWSLKLKPFLRPPRAENYLNRNNRGECGNGKEYKNRMC